MKEEDAKRLMRQLHDSEAEVEELTQNVDDVLDQLKECERECQRLCSITEEETARSMKLESEVEGQRVDLEAGSELEKNLSETSARVTQAESKASELGQSLAKSKNEIEEKKQQIQTLNDELKEEKKGRAQMATTAVRLQEDLESEKNKLEASQKKHKELQGEL